MNDEEKEFIPTMSEVAKKVVEERKERGKKFNRWHSRLLFCSEEVEEDMDAHPLGSCLYRDIIRDEAVKEAMRRAWHKIKPEG